MTIDYNCDPRPHSDITHCIKIHPEMYGLHMNFQAYKSISGFIASACLSMQMHATAKDCMTGYPYGNQD